MAAFLSSPLDMRCHREFVDNPLPGRRMRSGALYPGEEIDWSDPKYSHLPQYYQPDPPPKPPE